VDARPFRSFTRVPGRGHPSIGKGFRWRARYLDPDGRERSRSFAAKVMAEKFLTEVEHSKIAGSYRDPDTAHEVGQ
jgi:hypothetical protein